MFLCNSVKVLFAYATSLMIFFDADHYFRVIQRKKQEIIVH